MVSVNVINAGRTKDSGLLAILREIAFICASVNCQIKACHIAGQDNRLADRLSRAHLGNNMDSRLSEIMDNSWSRIPIEDHLFTITNDW